MTEKVAGFFESKIWDILLKIALIVIVPLCAASIKHEARITRLEEKHSSTEKDKLIEQLQLDVKILLDRTARIETKIEKL